MATERAEGADTAGASEGAEVSTTFDVIMIGAGPVGENVADRTVKGGLSTLIVEK